MQQPPVPEPRDLLPPLLACLSTSQTSASPPPALLALLAPILRQRLTFLASSGTSTVGGWTKLLCWESQHGDRLAAIVARLDLEPHPVSGEVEIDDVKSVDYKRLDNETLRARLLVDQFSLLPIYVWCSEDEHGQTGPGWKLTELKILDDTTERAGWYNSIAEANEAFAQSGSLLEHASRNQSIVSDPDDDYWAAYDATPSETPGNGQRPAAKARAPSLPVQARSDDDYYARYGNEVQPALDAHDPDEDVADTGESTLTGTQQRSRRPISLEITAASPPLPAVDGEENDDARPAWQKALYPHASKSRAHDSAVASSLSRSAASELNMPRPISPTSSTHSVERLEAQAAAMSDENTSSNRFELGIRQHMSTEIKSLFRLAKTAGMTRTDFEELVKRELDVLSLLDDE